MTEIRSAAPELVSLAVAMRPDWDGERLQSALVAAYAAGWKWERTFREVARLLLIEDSGPNDLRIAAGETRITAPGSLPGDLRAQVLADAQAATERQRLRDREREAGAA